MRFIPVNIGCYGSITHKMAVVIESCWGPGLFSPFFRFSRVKNGRDGWGRKKLAIPLAGIPKVMGHAVPPRRCGPCLFSHGVGLIMFPCSGAEPFRAGWAGRCGGRHGEGPWE